MNLCKHKAASTPAHYVTSKRCPYMSNGQHNIVEILEESPVRNAYNRLWNEISTLIYYIQYIFFVCTDISVIFRKSQPKQCYR